jgi:hypothetical protein
VRAELVGPFYCFLVNRHKSTVLELARNVGLNRAAVMSDTTAVVSGGTQIDTTLS